MAIRAAANLAARESVPSAAERAVVIGAEPALHESRGALDRIAGGLDAGNAEGAIDGGAEIARHAGDVRVVSPSELAESIPARGHLVAARLDGVEIAVDRGERRCGRVRIAQPQERGLGETVRARRVIGAREIHLRARMLRHQRENALERDDRIVRVPAVERGDAEEIIELGVARHVALQGQELGVSILRVAGREERPRPLDARGLRQRRHDGARDGREKGSTNPGAHAHCRPLFFAGRRRSEDGSVPGGARQ